MALIEMNDELRIGFPLIDKDHKELFSRINDLHDAVESKSNQVKVEEIFTFLEDYVVSHFGLEEKLMIRSCYDGFLSHRDAHTHFMNEYISLKASFMENKDNDSKWSAAESLEALLRGWLSDHIMTSDKKLGNFLLGL